MLNKMKEKLTKGFFMVDTKAMSLKYNGLKETLKDSEGGLIETVIIWGLVAVAAIAIGIAVMNAVKGRSDEMVDEIEGYNYVK